MQEGEEGRWASPWRRWWEGGWLGETTEAGERERREREGGELVKPRIFMKTASVCVCFFLSPSSRGDTPLCLQKNRGSKGEKEKATSESKRRRSPSCC